ncbi:hypothetical protein [uncultured Lacinutrix sp.]|uniref:hypothetical protein n=1 Tax=uncultured Lacinutrix sp. TaxID=574032 RepID=UPI002602E49D|nr:hypothetical protein [uncultured Lacinutrix sp.]
MKKKLESELMSIAHKILKLKGKEDVNKMHTEVAALYEKLTVLKFAQDNFDDVLPTIGNDSSFFGMLDTAFNNTVSDNIEVGSKTYIDLDERDDDEIMEPVMEKIKDMVAQMPQETQQIDAVFEAIQPKHHKNDFEDITADFNEIPIFDKVSDIKTTEKKSLNDKLKSGGLTIGLNDKLAFIKHLFDSKNEDYDRVISQLNTMSSFVEASTFIENNVKPDYKSWDTKEEYVERFMAIIESRFN